MTPIDEAARQGKRTAVKAGSTASQAEEARPADILGVQRGQSTSGQAPVNCFLQIVYNGAPFAYTVPMATNDRDNVVPHPTIALLRSASLSSAAQHEIERMILEGELGPGSKLTEAWLSERLGVSRGPIREAFRMLEEAGLVRQEKNRGVFVRDIPLEEALEIYWQALAFPDQKAVGQVSQFYRVPLIKPGLQPAGSGQRLDDRQRPVQWINSAAHHRTEHVILFAVKRRRADNYPWILVEFSQRLVEFVVLHQGERQVHVVQGDRMTRCDDLLELSGSLRVLSLFVVCHAQIARGLD